MNPTHDNYKQNTENDLLEKIKTENIFITNLGSGHIKTETSNKINDLFKQLNEWVDKLEQKFELIKEKH